MRDRESGTASEPIVVLALDLAASIDPIWLLTRPAAKRGPRWFWETPGGCSLAACGAAHWLHASGPDRFERVEAGLGACRLRGDVDAARWLGGFAFWEGEGSGPWSGFPGALFVLPELSLIRDSDRLRLVLAATASRAAGLPARAEALRERIARAAEPASCISESDLPGKGRGPAPSREISALLKAQIPEIQARIAPAVAAIRAGRADKVVLATAFEHWQAASIDPLALLARQRATQPDCFRFLIAPTPEASFIGATPERLLRIRAGRLETMALAGSVRRGVDAAEDAALAAGLLASAKDQREHALVVEAIHASLRALGAEMEDPPEPRVRRLAGIQHLETPIAARLPGRERLLEVARRLHPTPALGGSPREAALGLIAEMEARSPGRGWYAGGVGWVDQRGEGELAVAIRSLLLRGPMALGMAGAGLVADSDPELEAHEIALKLGLALAALED
jgi:menaquinone-specific isochorismate synthase